MLSLWKLKKVWRGVGPIWPEVVFPFLFFCFFEKSADEYKVNTV
jgi:hypothetical protein